MSWSASFKVEPGVSPEDIDFSNVSNIEEVPEHLEQFREGVAAAVSLILSGVVGNHEKSFKVNLGGHGNESHEPVEGWSADFVTISIHQLEEEK